MHLDAEFDHRCGLTTGGDESVGGSTRAGGGNSAWLQGDGFGSFTAGAVVLLLAGFSVFMVLVS